MIDPITQARLKNLYNPEGSDLRTIQNRLLNILSEFDRICRKNGIRYWLDSGTILGAVRHGGFIPWDDDIDVCILKKDYRKLKKAMQKELPENFSFYDMDSKDYFARRYPKIVDESVQVTSVIKSKDDIALTEKLWMDVFLLIEGSPNISRFVNSFYGRCYRRKFNIINDGKLKHMTGVCLYPVAIILMSFFQITGKLFHHGNYIFNYGSGFYSVRKKKDIFPLTTISFEGHDFLAPCNCDSYLTRIYGDYMSLPKQIETHNIISIDYGVTTRFFK